VEETLDTGTVVAVTEGVVVLGVTGGEVITVVVEVVGFFVVGVTLGVVTIRVVSVVVGTLAEIKGF
jgi:hypothetical protein